MSKLLRVLLWIWQFPQNILAELIIRFVYTESDSYKFFTAKKGVWFFPTVVRRCFMDNFTLGDYVFITCDLWLENHYQLRKSYGYVLSSRILGPLWLPLIGIPKVVYAFYDPMGYYLEGHYTETFATYLSRKKKTR